jgi:hypothetical protein
MARRNFASSIYVNALAKSKPAEVARNSLTNEGRVVSRLLSLWPAERGRCTFEEKRNRHLKDLNDVLQAAAPDAVAAPLFWASVSIRTPGAMRQHVSRQAA